MMKILVTVAVLLLGTQAANLSNLKEWANFKSAYNKNYQNAAEEELRSKAFHDNLKKINEHNKRYEMGLVSYTLGVNQFTDKTHSELIQMMAEPNPMSSSHQNPVPFVSLNNGEIPDFLDWRTKGAVTPVKNQGMHVTAWSFSSTGALEGQFYLKTGKLISLSEQNLIDCVNVSSTIAAFSYVAINHGIDTESSYPYVGRAGQCRYNPKNSAGKVKGFDILSSSSEETLKKVVAEIGPISAYISIPDSFIFYAAGVYDDPDCSEIHLNFPVLIVGYGTTAKGQDYWIVKNSFGKTWGEDGYILMARNKDNLCGIASYNTYPAV